MDLMARPTLYRGIPMRSRLEARAAGELHRRGFFWEYEPDCFADESGQYLPDFEVIANSGFVFARSTYVEVKPRPWAEAAKQAALRKQMEIIWRSRPRAELAIWLPETQQIYLACPHHREWREECADCFWCMQARLGFTDEDGDG